MWNVTKCHFSILDCVLKVQATLELAGRHLKSHSFQFLLCNVSPCNNKKLDNTKRLLCIPLNSLSQTLSSHGFHTDLPQIRIKQDPDKEYPVIQ